MPTLETAPRLAPAETGVKTRFLVVDTESVPDGRLIADVKYPGENLSPEDAIARAQAEARELSNTGSDFLPVTFQVPIAVCVIRVGTDFSLQAFKCLDEPHYRPAEVVKQFWRGVEDTYKGTSLVTFNGRGFDMPLLELAAFRQGLAVPNYWQRSRNRFNGSHIDVQERLTNYGASRMNGGLNLLAKMIGKPGKTDVSGCQVFQMHREGRLAEINDYCLCDTLDTYFVFLRSSVLTGDLPAEREAELVRRAREFLESRADDVPVLKEYLANWEQ